MERNRHYTLWLLGIIAATFALQQIIPGFTRSIELVSAEAWQKPWMLLTSIFAHANIAHILFNGLALAIFGSILEERAGSRRFLLIFFGSGILSSVGDTFFYHASLGASGAIFGVMGTLAVLEPMMTVYVYYVPMPLVVAALGYAALDVFGFFTGIQTSAIGRVANIGHLSGLAAGLVAGFALRGKKPISLGRKNKHTFLSADEFDEWEKENMGKSQ